MRSEFGKILALLTSTPKSAAELAKLSGLGDKQVRNEIDALRREFCVWYCEKARGFWIDEPVSKQLPVAPMHSRWKRSPS